MTSAQEDLRWMQECLKLAAQAQGCTAPNPLVGSVIVKDGNLLGAGYHPQAGQPHAEIYAIANALDQFPNSEITKGATLYVNLEPCNHYGKTPPCTEAIIQAGIKRVVIGMIDPDHRVSGGGRDRLIAAGITVTVGVAEADCQALNEGFSHRIKSGKPFGILKYAMTLDGKIATNTGHSYWITGEPARHRVHLLRSTCDAVITGGHTVRLDNPHLTTHNLTAHSPLRVVMSRSLDLPKLAHLWQVDAVKTLVITITGQNPDMQNYLRDRGVEVMEFDDLTPDLVMAELGKRGCNQVLWECGGRLAAQAISDRAVQKVYAFIAPKIIGGQLSPVADLGYTTMTQALNLTKAEITTLGEDLLVVGYLP